MNFYEADAADARENIKLLERKKELIRNKATREGRPLDKSERSHIADLDNAIADLQGKIVEGPVTIENWGSGRSYTGDGFSNLGGFLQAVAKSSMPGNAIDHRLFNATGLGETVPSEGGFLVGSDMSYDLLKGVFDSSTLPSMCTRFQISGNANSINLPAIDETSRVDGSRWGGTRGYWVAEASEKTASKPKFRNMELNLHKLCGLCYTSDELLQDSNALEMVVRESFIDEIGFRLTDAIVNGTGAGQPLGILNSGCLVTVDAEAGQTSGVLLENVMKMYSRMLPRSRKNAVWLINQSVEPELYTMSLAVGTGGGPVFMPAGGASASPYATLFGRPIVPCEQCAALNTVGDIIFADMSSYLLAEKGGIKTDMSIHVRFIYDESVFRFVYRVDGQPRFASAITPFKGSDTLSPFVCLATRA